MVTCTKPTGMIVRSVVVSLRKRHVIKVVVVPSVDDALPCSRLSIHSTALRRSSTVSSGITNTPEYRMFVKWTTNTLDPVKTPLGTLNDRYWSDVLKAMEFWIKGNVPRNVDTVDRLLKRLLYEHSLLPKNHGRYHEQHHTLSEWMLRVMQAWISISKHFPDAPYAVSKAQRWLDELQNWNILIQPADFCAIVEAHWRLSHSTTLPVKHQSIQAATRMLHSEYCWKNVIPNIQTETTKNSLIESFRNVLRIMLESLANKEREMNGDGGAESMTEAAMKLIEQMDLITQLPGWENVRPDTEEMNKILDVLFLDSTKPQPKHLSEFEQRALEARILQRINAASSPEYQSKVEALVKFWRETMNDDQEKDIDRWKPFAQATVNYYLRIQDVVQATQWMQRLEQIPTPEEMSARQTPPIETSEQPKSELEIVNTVFRENQEERIHQKKNLLNIWVDKISSPVAPFRATEILESLEAEEDISLDPKLYVTVVRMWLESSHTVGHAQKILDIAVRCPKFDKDLLELMVRILVKEDRETKSSTKPNRGAITAKLSELLQEHWDSYPPETAHTIGADTLQLLIKNQRSLLFANLLKFMIEKRAPLPGNICKMALRLLPKASPPDMVMRLLLTYETTVKRQNALAAGQVPDQQRKSKLQEIALSVHDESEVLEKLQRANTVKVSSDDTENESIETTSTLPITPNSSISGDVSTAELITSDNNEQARPNEKGEHQFVELDFVCYQLAMQRLLETTDEATVKISRALLKKILVMLAEKRLTCKGEQLNYLLLVTIKSYGQESSPKGSSEVLALVESTLLKDPARFDGESPVSLGFYKKVMNQLLKKGQMKQIKRIFNKLEELHAAGFLNLYPDTECVESYFEALSLSGGSINILDRRVELLQKLIERYVESEQKAEQYKPLFSMIDGIVGGLKKRSKTLHARSDLESKQKLEEDTQTALLLIGKMQQLDIKPESEDRPYVFNVAMELVLDGVQDSEKHYGMVMDIKRQMEEFGIKPNLPTYFCILRACAHCRTEFALEGSTVLLNALTEVRRLDKADARVYMACFQALIANANKIPPAKLDRIVSTIFQCCCEDGAVTSYSKRAFKELCSPSSYHLLYESKLNRDSMEPPEWNRNAGNFI